MKKITTIILIVMILLGAVSMTACNDTEQPGGKDTTPAVTTAGEGTPTAPAETTTAAPYSEKDALPEMDYKDETVTILIWKSSENEFYCESDVGETIDSAIFNRNIEVQSRMNIELKFEEIPGNSANADSYIAKVQANVLGGDKAFDIMAGYARNAMSCAINGYMLDIYENDNIDLDAPWYRHAVINACSIGNKIFTVAGDISHSSIARISGVFFNADMIKEYSLDDPYDLVLGNEWVMTKFIEMNQNLYTDLNSNGTRDKGDSFGLICDNIMLDCAQYAGGVKFISKDADNNPVLSEDLKGEKIIQLIDLWINAIAASGMNVDNDDTSVWVDGKTVFYLYPLAYVRNEKWKTLDYTYGFVPQPKFDTAQENYITSLTNYFSLWGIPAVVKNEDMSAQLIECMSSEGYHYITPAVFETAYKYKYTNDETSRQSRIFDILRENIYCDFGKICAASLNNLPNHLFADTVQSGYNNFTQKIAATKRQLEKSLKAIIENVDK